MKRLKITQNKSMKVWLWVLPIAGLFLLPFVALFTQLINSTGDVWQHLWDTVLLKYLGNSVLLMCLVGLGTVLLGLSSAWLVASFEFPGRRYFEWLLILPMAMPAYIVAYAYTWLLDVSGPVQAFYRSTFGVQFGEYYFPNVRSMGGAAIMLALVLYPYIYMLCRGAFFNQSQRLWEANLSLGRSVREYFMRVALPLIRPALFGGLALVLMETLADYGTVEYFGVKTLTTGVFKSWFGLGSLSGAAQVSAIILMLLIAIMVIEKALRGGARFDAINPGQQTVSRLSLQGRRKWYATLWCGLIVAFGFVFPVLILLVMAYHSSIQQWYAEFLSLAWHTASLAAFVAVLTVGVGLLLITLKRFNHEHSLQGMIKVLSIGYAIPGLVIAVGVTIAYGWLDIGFNGFVQLFSDKQFGLVFSGGFVALITAYVIRFLAVAMQPIEAGYKGLSRNLDEVSALTGKSHWYTFRKIHFPLLKGGILTAMLLVFVDLLKELPATLVLRPFNFNTLAVKTYELASDERLADSALPALCIVAVGVLPVLLINRRIQNSHD